MYPKRHHILLFLLALMTMFSCGPEPTEKEKFQKATDVLVNIDIDKLPPEYGVVLKMPRPNQGLGRCKGDCSVYLAENLRACLKYCECAYKNSSIADQTNGAPPFWQEFSCRVNILKGEPYN